MSKNLQELTDELVALTSAWDANRIVPNDQRKRVREIGEEINKIGGIQAMRDAYYAAKAKNRAVTQVQAYWDCIGQWRW